MKVTAELRLTVSIRYRPWLNSYQCTVLHLYIFAGAAPAGLLVTDNILAASSLRDSAGKWE